MVMKAPTAPTDAEAFGRRRGGYIDRRRNSAAETQSVGGQKLTSSWKGSTG
jgi:hypothetical protein